MVAGVVLLFGVHGNQAVEFDPPSPESVRLGEQIFVANCAVCHGIQGEGDGPNAGALPYPPPRLGDHVPFHGNNTLFLWVSDGLPSDADIKIMPAFKTLLTEDERLAVVDFLRATWTFGDFNPVIPEDLLTPEGDTP